jgi:hypothetical protein
MLDAIFKILAAVAGWFSPEQRTKAKRERREAIKKEIRRLKRLECTEEISRKIERLQNELEKINDSLGA